MHDKFYSFLIDQTNKGNYITDTDRHVLGGWVSVHISGRRLTHSHAGLVKIQAQADNNRIGFQ